MGAIIAYFFVNDFIEHKWRVTTALWAIGLFGMAAQLVYTLMSRRVLNSEAYEEIDTLDNEMMYSEEDDPRIIQNSGFTLFCALIGGVVSTSILILSALTFKIIFALQLEILERTLVTLFIVLGLLLSVPVVIYNFRTYKLSGLRENS
jgi:hypothetical protein